MFIWFYKRSLSFYLYAISKWMKWMHVFCYASLPRIFLSYAGTLPLPVKGFYCLGFLGLWTAFNSVNTWLELSNFWKTGPWCMPRSTDNDFKVNWVTLVIYCYASSVNISKVSSPRNTGPIKFWIYIYRSRRRKIMNFMPPPFPMGK